MHYYTLNLSCQNSEMPLIRKIVKELKSKGVKIVHDYGMCFSDDPQDWVDYYQSARSPLDKKGFELLVQQVSDRHGYLVQVSDLNPNERSIRGRTYRDELA